MAGIRVCLPGKCTAVVSVTPLKVKYPVGHADHSEVAPTTIGTYVYIVEHAGVLFVNPMYLHLLYTCVMLVFRSHLKPMCCTPQVITPRCLPVHLEGPLLRC